MSLPSSPSLVKASVICWLATTTGESEGTKSGGFFCATTANGGMAANREPAMTSHVAIMSTG